MTIRVLVTGAGGGGGCNLIESLRRSSLDLEIHGSNLSAQILAKSTADHHWLLPEASSDDYTAAMVELVRRQKIDVIVPNNDREIAKVGDIRDQLPCNVFLPPNDTIQQCQDKYEAYQSLRAAGLPVAESCKLDGIDDVEDAMRELDDGQGRWWLRMRKGSGSKGATWVRNADQARAWLDLWQSLRGYPASDFMVCRFLPGRDYAFQSVWNNGRLVVAKKCERLSYFFGENRLSGMSSTPEVACTVRDDAALELIFKAIHIVCPEPHGNFCMDLKGDINGVMNITEFNIGRFCMITPIFDWTGKINTAEAYVRCAMGESPEYPEPVDIEPDMYMLRDLDTPPTVVAKHQIDQLETQSRIS